MAINMYAMIAQLADRSLPQTWLFKAPVQDMIFDPVTKLKIDYIALTAVSFYTLHCTSLSVREASKAGLQTT